MRVRAVEALERRWRRRAAALSGYAPESAASMSDRADELRTLIDDNTQENEVLTAIGAPLLLPHAARKALAACADVREAGRDE